MWDGRKWQQVRAEVCSGGMQQCLLLCSMTNAWLQFSDVLLFCYGQQRNRLFFFLSYWATQEEESRATRNSKGTLHTKKLPFRYPSHSHLEGIIWQGFCVITHFWSASLELQCASAICHVTFKSSKSGQKNLPNIWSNARWSEHISAGASLAPQFCNLRRWSCNFAPQRFDLAHENFSAKSLLLWSFVKNKNISCNHFLAKLAISVHPEQSEIPQPTNKSDCAIFSWRH